MQIRKLLATGLAALMAGSTLAMPALAATQLSTFPTFLGSAGQLDAFVVVGASAATADVVGAVDLAVRLAETSYTTVTTTGGAAVTGLDRDGIRVGGTADGIPLSTGGAIYSNPFPSSAVVKNIHFSGLKDSTIRFNSNDYDYREQVDAGLVRIRNDFSTANINGTTKMEVKSSDLIYEYVFEKQVTGLGDTGTPNYTYPVKIQMMGKDFTIVGVSDASGNNKIKMLAGSTGTATATTSIDYGDYKVYALLGSTNTLQMAVKDKDGNTVETMIFTGLSSGTASTKSTTKTTPILDVTVLSFGTLTDGTVVGADLVVGPAGTTTKEYDSSADVTSTGTANDAFPGASRWGIQTSGFTSAGTIPANAKIQVIYKPESTLYLKAGEKVSLPNNYGDLTFQGFGTSKFATVTIEPQNDAKSTYVQVSDSLSNGTFKGIRISTDVPGSIVSTAGNTFDEAFVFFNTSLGTTQPNTPVAIGFTDKAKNKVLINGSFANAAANASIVNPSEYPSFNLADQLNSPARGNILKYGFTLSYGGAGERNYFLNVTIEPNSTNPIRMSIGPRGDEVNVSFRNKTTLLSTSTATEWRLGATASSAEETEINVTTETGSAENVGKATTTVTDDSGIQILDANSNGASDRVKILVPSKELTARVTFGKEGATTTTTGTVNKIKSVTAAVAVLDTEVTATEKAKNLVLVGGPCVNKITAEALNVTYPACGSASTIPENAAIIKAVDNAFTTGKVALVVAGWEASNTRTATSVLQQRTAELKGSASTVSGTTATSATIAAA